MSTPPRDGVQTPTTRSESGKGTGTPSTPDAPNKGGEPSGAAPSSRSRPADEIPPGRESWRTAPARGDKAPSAILSNGSKPAYCVIADTLSPVTLRHICRLFPNVSDLTSRCDRHHFDLVRSWSRI